MTSTYSILVTGGAGYIGSHTTRVLCDAGHKVVVLDNLYSGHRWAVPQEAEFVEGNCADQELVEQLHLAHNFDAVIHFAGYVVVPESVSNPEKYYENNIVCTLRLIEQCRRSNIDKFVLSSSAAVYGMPGMEPVDENTLPHPLNPYGRSKLISEWTLEDFARASKQIDTQPFRYIALRYFNVAGASLDGSIGQATKNATHLIKVACETAAGQHSAMKVFGTDYNTPDGTCIRDYIHVTDLATAHLKALEYLGDGGESTVLNCGYGHGYSVEKVIQTCKSVSQIDFTVDKCARRPGDSAAVVANNSKILKTLDWKPQLDNLELICESAWNWEKILQAKK